MLARLSGVFKGGKGGSLPSSPAPATAHTPKAAGGATPARAPAGEDQGEVEAILAACAVADSTGDWTSLRFLITWRGCPADDLWDVPLSAFGNTPKDCLAAANAVLADSYAHFAYLGIPPSAFRCETLLKAIYVNWRHFDGVWLGAPAAVALAGARQQRLSRVADSFPVAVPALSDDAFEAATGRGAAFDADWVNPNKAAKAAKAPKSAAKAKAAKAKGTPKKAKLPKVEKKPKAAKKTAAAAGASPKPVKKASVKKAAPAKKPGPKPKAAAPKAASPEPEEEEEAAQEEAESESEEEEDTPPPKKKKAAATPSTKAAGAASPAGATPKRKPGRPPKILPFAASPAAAAKFAAEAVASPPKKRGRPSNAERAARAAAAAAAAAADDDDSS